MRLKARRPNFHEIPQSDEAVTPGSERSFGLVMAAAFAVLGLINWFHDGGRWPWLVGAAVVFLGMALLWPNGLKPLNWIWFKIGVLLHAVVNPLVLGAIYFLAIWPTGLIMRFMGKELIALKREPERASYWLAREPPGPAPESMKDQF